MATEALGDQIDLHGGGQDLIFPHHENEIAQSQAKTGKAPFVSVWLHAGFLNVEGEKMSKSLSNFIVLSELLDEMQGRGLDPEALRFYFLQTHYRSKIDYHRKGLEEAHAALERLHRTRTLLAEAVAARPAAEHTATASGACDRLREAFAAAMDDDFHTPTAIAALFDFCRHLNPDLEAQRLAPAEARLALTAMEECGRVLTLFGKPPAPSQAPVAKDTHLAPDLLHFAQANNIVTAGRPPQQVLDALVQLRAEARKAKDWKRGDAIRDAMKAAGYAIEDTPHGQRWSRIA
jgi:cysteinyl-tRNA synthetase